MEIQVHDIRKTFDGTAAALDGISLTIRSGELLALLGPSGSGKTTLLRVIAGLEFPTGGSVLFDGDDASHRTVQERNVGFVFQHYALFRHMTVLDNVGFGLAARPRANRPAKAEIRRRAEELLALVQLQGLEHRSPAQLSGGQRQRVALARALAIEPTVLLLDEPFGALDAKVRKDLRRWLRQLHDRTGHTTVFVTHDQEEALELSDRVAIINQGRLEQIGTPSEAYLRPESAFVFDFLGSTNVLPVEVRDGRAFFAGCPVPVADGIEAGDGHYTLQARPCDMMLAVDRQGPGLGGIAEMVRVSLGRVRVDMKVGGLARPIELELPMKGEGWRELQPGQSLRVRIDRYHLFAAP
ncbi:sulfate/molybdate ABC transporter ATP-binding protein [Roseospirillum parvum]|uniref:Sulfate transport system ATP-binding protein n=1 Tax=Roseospirillum parvum TaxID=83401 RepID=A0A1G7Y8J1_9PROT|nr:sulfate/molybdate ABC transporter ATP-binding protein [Roseospirillum parvum]SDG92694.1 sulfate transport system ATP-binding protein [Roseospirillum parvum]